MADAPVQLIPGDAAKGGPVPGTGLCLSGGGYRAMVFHVGVSGACTRPPVQGSRADLERVRRIDHAGMLGLKWRDSASIRSSGTTSSPKVVAPLRELAGETIDAEAVSPRDCHARQGQRSRGGAYKEHLFGDKTLQDLPDQPRFIINATKSSPGGCGASEALHARLPRRRGEESDRPPGPGGRRLLGVSAGAFAGRDAARSAQLHARFRHGPAAPAVHQQGDARRRRHLRQSRPGDRLEALPDRPGERRGHQARRRRGAEEGLGAALLSRLESDRQPGARAAQAPGDRRIHGQSGGRQPSQGRLSGGFAPTSRTTACRTPCHALLHGRWNSPKRRRDSSAWTTTCRSG